MIPTRTEHALRVQVVQRIEEVVLQMWPDAHVSEAVPLFEWICRCS